MGGGGGENKDTYCSPPLPLEEAFSILLDLE